MDFAIENVFEIKNSYDNSRLIEESNEDALKQSLSLNNCHFSGDYDLDVENYFIAEDISQDSTYKPSFNSESSTHKNSEDIKVEKLACTKRKATFQVKSTTANSLTLTRETNSKIELSSKDNDEISTDNCFNKSLGADADLIAEEISDIHSFLVKKRKSDRKRQNQKKGMSYLSLISFLYNY